MKSPPKKKPRDKPATNREALWPADPLTDAHNNRVIEQLAEKAKEKGNERLHNNG